MLRAITIQNVVLIDHLDLEFDRSLSVLTGETGAGKSILLDALGLALGGRSDSRLVSQGTEQAVVTATFDIPMDHPCIPLLHDHGIEIKEELLLRRVLTKEGRSRAFINDQPVNISLLSTIGSNLVEIHGQFDRLLEPKSHRRFLDNYAECSDLVSATQTSYENFSKAQQALRQAQELAEEKQVNEAFLRHALEELHDLNPKPGEEADLIEQRNRLANSSKISDLTQDILTSLEGEKGARNQINRAARLCEKGISLNEKAFTPIAQAMNSAIAELEESSALLNTLQQDCGNGPAQLDKIEKRLIALKSLARKHRCQVEELAELRQKLDKELDLIDNSEVRIKELERNESLTKADFLAHAKNLSLARKAAAKKLDLAIVQELAPLKLEAAQFCTQMIDLPENQWGPEGVDQVRFQVATNQGSNVGDLKTIASGGERARFMLALKVVLSHLSSIPTLVFDEIDSGIGGATARAVGERLKKLSHELQVLVITHSPQVASVANQHWRVEKKTQNKATYTTVTLLSSQDQREEIARMLAGESITQEARAAADQLLKTG